MSNPHVPSLLQMLSGEDPADPPFNPDEISPGRLDKRIVLQDRIWVDEHGTTHRLEEMEKSHQRNVIGFLAAQAAEWHLSAVTWLLVQRLAESLDPIEIDRRALLLNSCPDDWMEATPLVRRLRAPHRQQPPRPRRPDHLTRRDRHRTLAGHHRGLDLPTRPGHTNTHPPSRHQPRPDAHPRRHHRGGQTAPRRPHARQIPATAPMPHRATADHLGEPPRWWPGAQGLDACLAHPVALTPITPSRPLAAPMWAAD